MACKIFFNYRRGEDAGVAHLLQGALIQAFEPDQVYADIANIAPSDYMQSLANVLEQCDVLLVLMGKNWVDSRDSAGRRRIDKSDDPVRAEIEIALKLGKLVIPILIGGAHLPNLGDLPESLKPFANFQSMPLRYEDFRADADRIIKFLKDVLTKADERRHSIEGVNGRGERTTTDATDMKTEKIVISYRRKDSQSTTRAIYERLEREFGAQAVFMDVKIPVGIDFRKHINGVLNGSDILLAIVGPKWLGKRIFGRPRIHDEEDWVRIEIESAIRRRVPIVPVLVDGAAIPSKGQLPATIRDIIYQNAARLDTGRDFSAHMADLIAGIREVIYQNRANQAERPLR
jgi:hypothetical protein